DLASIGASPAGRGAPAVAAGSTPGWVEVSAAGAGLPVPAGGSPTTVAVKASGGGFGGGHGAPAFVAVTAAGGGFASFTAGAGTSVVVTPADRKSGVEGRGVGTA